MSTSQPLPGSRSQSRKPVVHAAMAQAPDAQEADALGSTHPRPQAPQCAMLVSVLISQPLAALPSQSPAPPAQRSTVHAPDAQPWAATFESAHAAPHAPQLDGSTLVFAQNAASPDPQVRSGEAQVAPQVPPEQTRPLAQVMPQPPQLALSLRASTSQPLTGASVAVEEARRAGRDRADARRAARRGVGQRAPRGRTRRSARRWSGCWSRSRCSRCGRSLRCPRRSARRCRRPRRIRSSRRSGARRRRRTRRSSRGR